MAGRGGEEGILLRRSLKFASSSHALHKSLSRDSSCGSANGEKGFGKRKERERERKAGQWVDRRDSKDFHPSPSFNSWPSLQMLVSRAHTGKGFLPSSLFFLLLSLSFSPLVEIFSLSLSALDRGGGRIEIFRSHGSLRVKRERARSNLFRRVWIFCSGRWTGLDSGPVASDLIFLFFLREEEWRRFWGSWKFARLDWKKLR